MLRVCPRFAIELGRPEIVVEQIGDDVVGEQLHSTIRVMNDKPLERSQKLMRYHQRADRIVSCAAAGVANDMGIALGKTRIFRRVKSRIHAGQDGEPPRGRQSKLSLDVGIGGPILAFPLGGFESTFVERAPAPGSEGVGFFTRAGRSTLNPRR